MISFWMMLFLVRLLNDVQSYGNWRWSLHPTEALPVFALTTLAFQFGHDIRRNEKGAWTIAYALHITFVVMCAPQH